MVFDYDDTDIRNAFENISSPEHFQVYGVSSELGSSLGLGLGLGLGFESVPYLRFSR